MDYKNRDYFVIWDNWDYCFNHQIIKKMKRYFNYKIKCKYILINFDSYFYCISINKKDSVRLINYLKDNNIKYIKVFNEPIVLNGYITLFIDINKLFNDRSYWYSVLSDTKRKMVDKKILAMKKLLTSKFIIKNG